SDTGQGMTPMTAGRIFDPFFTTKRTGQGTGLGLSVVHGIVKDSGGVVVVQSEPGQGTVVQVFLPKLEPPDQPEEESMEVLPRGTERILLVDDEEALVRVAVTILERLGYQVTGKTDPKAALEDFQLDPGQFDLVITDLAMPRLQGLELAQAMMNIRPDLPVILCTGYNDAVSLESVREYGVRDLLIKPASLNRMAASIRQVLDKKE
ncbi:MAG: response regulator, partial [Deltaproteobacteria bacterium]|nr:response regulator [Deltaproteobacteria bacterium]